MSVLFNLSDKIIASDTIGDYLRFRKRVLADSGTFEAQQCLIDNLIQLI